MRPLDGGVTVLNVTLLCVGRLRETFYRDAAAEYAKRLTGYCKLGIVELAEQRLPQKPTPGQIREALDKEAEVILARLPRSGRVVALCVEGTPLSSEELARALENWTVGGMSSLTLILGGSYGLSPLVKRRADLRLSMSEMTFPHHLARVMALEQLYRAFKIREGSDYHK